MNATRCNPLFHANSVYFVPTLCSTRSKLTLMHELAENPLRSLKIRIGWGWVKKWSVPPLVNFPPEAPLSKWSMGLENNWLTDWQYVWMLWENSWPKRWGSETLRSSIHSVTLPVESYPSPIIPYITMSEVNSRHWQSVEFLTISNNLASDCANLIYYLINDPLCGAVE